MVHLGLGERSVTVNRQELLKALKGNRKDHVLLYAEAMAGYREVVKRQLTEKFDAAAKNLRQNLDHLLLVVDEAEDPKELSDVICLIQSVQIRLKKPRSYATAYDVAIKMAEWEVADTVELTQGQFECFVLDHWEWTEDFSETSSLYNN